MYSRDFILYGTFYEETDNGSIIFYPDSDGLNKVRNEIIPRILTRYVPLQSSDTLRLNKRYLPKYLQVKYDRPYFVRIKYDYKNMNTEKSALVFYLCDFCTFNKWITNP